MSTQPPQTPQAYRRTGPGQGNWVSRLDTFQTARQFRDFRLVWLGNFFAQSAQWMQILTVGWLVLKLTDNNALLTGTVIGVRTLPVLLIGPWAGVLADRVDRRKLIMIAQLCMAAAAATFAFLVIATDLDAEEPAGPLRWWHPFLYMIIAGVAHSVIQPVRNAIVANTVPREALTSALALNSMVFPTTRIIAPAIGGLIIATLGFNWNFLLETLGYLLMVVLMIPVRLQFRSTQRPERTSAFASMKAGMAYVWQAKPVLQLIVMSFVPNMVFTPLLFILPVFTSEVLGRDADAGGILSAALGVGGVVAAVIVATVGFVARKGTATFLGLAGGCFFVLVFAQSTWYGVSIATLAGLGFCQYFFRVGNSTLIQTIIPDDLRGRVMSIYQLDNGFVPLATLVTSWFVYIWNPKDVYTVIAIVSLVLVALQLAVFRQARQLA